MIFKKPKNTIEGQTVYSSPVIIDSGGESVVECVKCKKTISADELNSEIHVCPYCRYHFRINARQRIHNITDAGTFIETDSGLTPDNILGFPGYDDKLKSAGLASAESDSVVCGECEIGGNKTGIFVMEPNFMMGSMGRVTGEKMAAGGRKFAKYH